MGTEIGGTISDRELAAWAYDAMRKVAQSPGPVLGSDVMRAIQKAYSLDPGKRPYLFEGYECGRPRWEARLALLLCSCGAEAKGPSLRLFRRGRGLWQVASEEARQKILDMTFESFFRAIREVKAAQMREGKRRKTEAKRMRSMEEAARKAVAESKKAADRMEAEAQKPVAKAQPPAKQEQGRIILEGPQEWLSSILAKLFESHALADAGGGTMIIGPPRAAKAAPADKSLEAIRRSIGGATPSELTEDEMEVIRDLKEDDGLTYREIDERCGRPKSGHFSWRVIRRLEKILAARG